ncbi:MAG TPA: CopG family transcriptional regulator [Acidimicrobiia bacterium]|nr:CopG family transcriptional regulator [Acidimicrobiia bacterium]
MIRMQVQLTEEQLAALRRRAGERGVSISALIREAVDRHLVDSDVAARRRRAVEAVRNSHFRSGFTDISERHDDYLAEDFT